METTHVTTTAKNGSASAELDLDALAELDSNALGRLYADAPRPTNIDALEGNPRGRMLAVRSLDHGPIADALRSLAAAAFFPWGGKSFAGKGTSGAGINRLHLFGRHQLFPFHTKIQPSAIDGAPCIALDYDLPDNPKVIRMIHDEVREVSRGVYLGPAMWKAQSGPTLVLWFALDTRAQSKPIGHGREQA